MFVARRDLHQILPLKANRQHARRNDADHVHGGLAVPRLLPKRAGTIWERKVGREAELCVCF